jgi:trehalose 6-phosphate synthase/phosphatase
MPYGNGHSPTSRLFIVSNRLPVTIRTTPEGEICIERSSGGLATALARIHSDQDSLWIGWPGGHFRSATVRRRIEQILRNDYRCVPVFLSAQDIQRFYYGFSNHALWPLFHSFQSYFSYGEEQWESYVHANRMFCDAVLKEADGHELIWVHDYHLFLLPGMLRQHLPEARIGFFLHTPFPSSEMFRVLPCREALVRGLLGADLIGFQTFSYMQNFLWAVYRVLGIDAETGYLPFGGRQVAFEVHPIGIDPHQFLEAIHTDSTTIAEIARLDESIGSRKLLLGMDRLDYSKGIPARLRAYQRFLEMHDEWRERVSFIQVAVPSREKVLAYQELKRQVDELVGEINGVYGTTTWTPVQYVHRNLPFHEICALLRRADVALVTPLRDGMNLIAKEYVACQENRAGALILSEFAGASSEMGEAFFVNPYDEEGMAARLHEVLSLPEELLLERMTALHERIRGHTVDVWCQTFLASLESVQHMRRTRMMTPRIRQRLLNAYANAKRRVLLLDYDGTLTPLVKLRHRAAPSPQLLAILRALQADQRNLVAVISGRDRETLERWLGDCGCTLVAEHGAWLREGPGGEWRTLLPELKDDWKSTIRPILENLVEQTPGSSLEEKDFSLVWHYRMADPEFGLWQARELHSQLQGMLAGTGLHVQGGNKVVEVKWAEVHKGLAASRILERAQPADFILAIGDDRTDEDLFAAVPQEQWTIKVGTGFSAARFSLSTPTDVLWLLSEFTGKTVDIP